MAKVLHIDGLNSESFNGVIASGTLVADVIRQMGGTIRTEQVPDKPRELSAEAKVFLAGYK